MSKQKILKTFVTSIVAFSCFFVFVVPAFTSENAKHSYVGFEVCSYADIDFNFNVLFEAEASYSEIAMPRQITCCNNMLLHFRTTFVCHLYQGAICQWHTYTERFLCISCGTVRAERSWIGYRCRPPVWVR